MFWSRGDGLWVDEEDGAVIYLPSKEFIGMYDPDCSPDAFWELVYHELSHHASNILYDKGGHCTKMYEILTGLVLTNDLSLTILNTYERDYKPRAWKSGRYAAGRAIIEKNRKRRKN